MSAAASAICCDCGNNFARDDDEQWKVRCLRCWIARKGTNASRYADPIVAELRLHMRGLLSLSHPDRHNGSKLATSTTQWLLDLRERIAREVAR